LWGAKANIQEEGMSPKKLLAGRRYKVIFFMFVLLQFERLVLRASYGDALQQIIQVVLR
jgi:hypothetical protein